MRIVLAPDKFKGSLTAPQAVRALRRGLRQSLPNADVIACPLADGGEGTVDAAVAAGFERIPAAATGPRGEPVRAHYARRGSAAVVELALASGLQLLPGQQRAPMTASSFGTGQLIAAAVEAGADTLVLGIGGSACTDGGAGLVTALGARLRDAQGHDLALGGRALSDLADLKVEAMRSALVDGRRRRPEITIACDVTNPLLGPTGAAAIYGPQKGARPEEVLELDRALARWADVVEHTTGIRGRDEPGAGAAGGVGFAALTLLGSQLRPGIEVILDLLDFEEHVVGADLVLTGEGSFDAQTLFGKAPAGVAAAARHSDVPVVAVAGTIEVSPQDLEDAGFVRGYALTDIEPNPAVCVAHADQLLEQLGRKVGEDLIGGHLLA